MHGTHDVVNRICDHPDIKAISFVGSNAAGKHIYERGCSNGKRVQVPIREGLNRQMGCFAVLSCLSVP